MDTNAVGFTRLVGCAYRYFANNGGGHIACITSIAGTKGLGPAPAYSASKAMQNTYLQALEQLAISKHHNIHFTDIRPGFVDTPPTRWQFSSPYVDDHRKGGPQHPKSCQLSSSCLCHRHTMGRPHLPLAPYP